MSNITILVRDITYFYIRHYYEKELTIKGVKKLEENVLQDLINMLYVEKSGELKKYIRETLKENLKENYSSFQVENIILEMFSEPEMAKHRVFIEIMEYQKTI
jgi:hypothetical protein